MQYQGNTAREVLQTCERETSWRRSVGHLLYLCWIREHDVHVLAPRGGSRMWEVVLAQLHQEGRWHLESRGCLPELSAANLLTLLFTVGHLWCLQILRFSRGCVSYLVPLYKVLSAQSWCVVCHLDPTWYNTSDSRNRPHHLLHTGSGSRNLDKLASLQSPWPHTCMHLMWVLIESVLLRNQTGLL